MMTAVHLVFKTITLVFLHDVIGNGLLPLAVLFIYLVLYSYAVLQANHI